MIPVTLLLLFLGFLVGYFAVGEAIARRKLRLHREWLAMAEARCHRLRSQVTLLEERIGKIDKWTLDD